MDRKPETLDFYAKTWIDWAVVLISGPLTVFSLVMGPLFLFDIIQSNDGRPGYEAGIPMTIIGCVIVLPVFIFFLAKLNNRRSKPLIAIYAEGLIVQLWGRDCFKKEISLFGLLFSLLTGLPYLFSRSSLVPSKNIYKRAFISWDEIQFFTEDHSLFYFTWAGEECRKMLGMQPVDFIFSATTFSDPQRVSRAISFFLNEPEHRKYLRSWSFDGMERHERFQER